VTTAPEDKLIRRRRSPDDLRREIMSAAEAEFTKAGFASTTTAAIAAAANTTEAQIFRYFPSKAALFREAMVQPLDQHLRGFLDDHDDNAEAHSDQAEAYIAELIQFIGRHKEMFRSLVMAEQQNVDGIATVDALGDYFARGAASMEERHPKEAKIAPDLMVRISFATVLGHELFKDWLYPPGEHDPQVIRQALTRFVMDAVYAESVAVGVT
jgi:AcrR family transcriptional regulator